jgi:transposase-like protein
MPFETKVFDKYSRVEGALINTVIEPYIQGVSTRKVQDIVSQFGVEDRKNSMRKLEEFLKRPIEHPIPYLFCGCKLLQGKN